MMEKASEASETKAVGIAAHRPWPGGRQAGTTARHLKTARLPPSPQPAGHGEPMVSAVTPFGFQGSWLPLRSCSQ